MQPTQKSDRQLITQYIAGEEKAFELLLERHQSRVYTSIYLFVKDEQIAEDLFQDTFIKVIDTLRTGRYNDEGKFGQWVVRIAHNLCVDHFRRNRRMPTVAPTETHDVFNDMRFSDTSHESDIIQRQTLERVRFLVDSLPDEQREVVILRHYGDLSFKEIADSTNVSINTALGRMRYALMNIRKMMAEHQISL